MRIPGTYGKTLLHLAARRNFSGLCWLLLRLGADVNRRDILDRTALHYAAEYGGADTAKVLIEYSADLNARDWKEKRPLDLAEAKGNMELVQTIQEAISRWHTTRLKSIALASRKDFSK